MAEKRIVVETVVHSFSCFNRYLTRLCYYGMVVILYSCIELMILQNFVTFDRVLWLDFSIKQISLMASVSTTYVLAKGKKFSYFQALWLVFCTSTAFLYSLFLVGNLEKLGAEGTPLVFSLIGIVMTLLHLLGTLLACLARPRIHGEVFSGPSHDNYERDSLV